MTNYRTVRAIERGLAVLDALATHGAITPAAIAGYAQLDRATVYRQLNTLVDAGYVGAISGGRFRLTARILGLASGYRIEEAVLTEIGPALHELHQAVVWPVSYSALRGDVMVVEESTLAISPYAVHNLKPGTTLSILRTSVGRAVLASMAPSRRRAISVRLADLERQSSNQLYSPRRIEDIVRRTQVTGYAHNIGDLEPNMSGLALPLLYGGVPIGAVGILFFTKGLSIRTAAERYLPALRACLARLERALYEEDAQVRIYQRQQPGLGDSL